MPTRRLPAQPNLAHLRNQAKDLLKGHRDRDERALQRLREFHPRLHRSSDNDIASSTLTLADAQLAIAREYGFPTWAQLKAFVENEDVGQLDLPAHERISDAAFRRAVDLLDAGDVEGLRGHLNQHPQIVRQRVTLLGGNYFQHPTLLEFIAENPSRHGSLPSNAVDVARVILDAGARENREAMTSALKLVASSAAAHKSGLQEALIDVLCEYGADPNPAVVTALLHAEFEAVNCLLHNGATLSLVTAAALGRAGEVRRLVSAANEDDRRLALALAAQHARTDTVRVLLEAGVSPNGFSQGHSHATALHQAALTGDGEVVGLLVNAGARRDVRDILFNGTPADWAQHNGHHELAEQLRSG